MVEQNQKDSLTRAGITVANVNKDSDVHWLSHENATSITLIIVRQPCDKSNSEINFLQVYQNCCVTLIFQQNNQLSWKSDVQKMLCSPIDTNLSITLTGIFIVSG